MSPEPELVAMCRADGVSLRQAGRQRYYGKCPFHHDTRPSFQVSLNDRGYWTFKCWSTNCNVYGGSRRYRELTGRPRSSTRESATPQDRTPLRPIAPALCHQAAVHYNEQLLCHPEAIAYLKRRGVEPELAQQWGLGYAAGASFYREASGWLDAAELAACYLFRHYRGEDRQARRIIIPHWWHDGTAGWHTARAIDPDAPRSYQSLPGSRPPLLSLRGSARRAQFVIITEGPFDLIACRTAGYQAYCTAGNPSIHRLAAAIRELAAGTIGILGDNDAAGQAWSEHVGAACHHAGQPHLLLRLPAHYPDPAETLTDRHHTPAGAISTAIRIARAQTISRRRAR